MFPPLTIYDVAILLLYLGGILSIGLYSLIKQRMTPEGYFFAARTSGWITLGASLFTTQFLMAIFLPLGGNVVTVAVTVMGTVVLMLLGRGIGKFVVPPAIGHATSETELGLTRGKPRNGVLAGTVIILAAIRLVATVLFCTYAFEALLGWNSGSAIIILILFVGLTTIVGGYQVVVTLQTFQMTGIIAAILMLAHVGNTICFQPDLWPMGTVAGVMMLGAWSWNGDQFFVQHRASARTSGEATKGLAFTVLLNIVCITAVLAIGAHAAPAPVIDVEIPIGARGILIAGVLSVVTSSLAGIFNSTAAYVTLNVFQFHLLDASERTIVLVARLTTTAIVIAAMAAIMVARVIGSEGVSFLQSAFGAVAAPMAALYCWNRLNRGRGWTQTHWPVILGMIVGGLRPLLEVLSSKGMEMNGWTQWFLSLPALAVSFYLFSATMLLFAGRLVQDAVNRE